MTIECPAVDAARSGEELDVHRRRVETGGLHATVALEAQVRVRAVCLVGGQSRIGRNGEGREQAVVGVGATMRRVAVAAIALLAWLGRAGSDGDRGLGKEAVAVGRRGVRRRTGPCPRDRVAGSVARRLRSLGIARAEPIIRVGVAGKAELRARGCHGDAVDGLGGKHAPVLLGCAMRVVAGRAALDLRGTRSGLCQGMTAHKTEGVRGTSHDVGRVDVGAVVAHDSRRRPECRSAAHVTQERLRGRCMRRMTGCTGRSVYLRLARAGTAPAPRRE